MHWLISLFLSFATPVKTEPLNLYRKPIKKNDREFNYFYTLFYIDTFYYTKGNAKDINIFVKFADTKHYINSKVVGECFMSVRTLVHLEPHYWAKASFFDKKILFYHEIGHCLFDLNHKSYSIMNETLLKESVYNPREYHFIHELFNGL
jgi:hypothetical protein